MVGEWDGDGIDDLALLVADADGVVVTPVRSWRQRHRHRRPRTAGSRRRDRRRSGAGGGTDLGDEAPWKGVTAFDGTGELDLWKVGGIVVEQSMVERASAMLAA
ncbi:MAG: hypothetical protein R2710_11475 [Acidimicrobiales bacterium]